MPREVLSQVAGKPYCRATRKGNLIFVSGQLGLDENEKIVSPDAEGQMRRIMDWIVEILAEGGATLDDVVMVNVYLSDLGGDYDGMNKVYFEYFGTTNMPARATVEVSRLAMDLRVEVSCVAALG